MIRFIDESDFFNVNEMLKYFNISIYDEINSPFVKFIVYEINDQIVGFIDYSFFGDRIEINYIYVDTKYRKQGLATSMLDFLLSITDQVQNITLEVSENNMDAINFYHKNGFIDVGIRENYYSNGINAILMIRRF